MMQETWDHIVVGAGSAGCLLVQRLTAAGRRVLLLEAGGPDRNLWIHLPVGYFKTIYNSRYSRLFDTEPSEGSGGRNIVWPRGRVVGGSSSINGLIYIRGQHADYDDWVRAGATGWDYRSNLPFFAAPRDSRVVRVSTTALRANWGCPSCAMTTLTARLGWRQAWRWACRTTQTSMVPPTMAWAAIS